MTYNTYFYLFAIISATTQTDSTSIAPVTTEQCNSKNRKVIDLSIEFHTNSYCGEITKDYEVSFCGTEPNSTEIPLTSLDVATTPEVNVVSTTFYDDEVNTEITTVNNEETTEDFSTTNIVTDTTVTDTTETWTDTITTEHLDSNFNGSFEKQFAYYDERKTVTTTIACIIGGVAAAGVGLLLAKKIQDYLQSDVYRIPDEPTQETTLCEI